MTDVRDGLQVSALTGLNYSEVSSEEKAEA